jgi:hypothetical protein
MKTTGGMNIKKGQDKMREIKCTKCKVSCSTGSHPNVDIYQLKGRYCFANGMG